MRGAWQMWGDGGHAQEAVNACVGTWPGAGLRRGGKRVVSPGWRAWRVDCEQGREASEPSAGTGYKGPCKPRDSLGSLSCRQR